MKKVISLLVFILIHQMGFSKNTVITHTPAAEPLQRIFSVKDIVQTEEGDDANNEKEVGVYYSNWFPYPTNWTNTGGCVWAEPELGWYESGDPGVIDQHTEWLTDAGVDFVIFDFSNNCGTEDGNRSINQHLWAIEDNAMAFVNRQVWRKENGLAYLKYAVFLGGCGINENFTNDFFKKKGDQIRDYYLVDPAKRELYYELHGKPFLGIWGPENLTPYVSHPDFYCQKIGSGLGAHNTQYNKSDYWSWEEHINPGYSMHNGEPECMTVHAAIRGTGCAPGVIYEYPDGLPGWLNDGSVFGVPTIPRNNGQTFRDHLDKAISADVRIILVQSFNEWTGCEENPGEEMDMERSNDIEPVKGGHTDLYMKILKEKVRIFKGLCESDTIVVDHPGPLVYDSLIYLNAMSSSGIQVDFELISGPAIIEGNSVIFTKPEGNVDIRAYHNGNDTICSTQEIISFEIYNQCIAQEIVFESLEDTILSNDTIILNAYSKSRLPIDFNIISGPAKFINDTAIQLTGSVGEVIVQASQPGNYTYCPAQNVIRSFNVNYKPHECQDCMGYVINERWSDIPGGTVDLIPVDSEPDFISKATTLESTKNIEDYYGIKLSGYLCAPYTGEYTFFLSGDDGCELWLSTNDEIPNKRLIAYVDGWTHYRDWTASPSQKSSPLLLTAGNKYYLEVLMKENNGEDHVSVKWQGPNNINDIVGPDFLDPSCIFQTISFPATCEQIGDSLFRINATSDSGLPVVYELLSGQAELMGDTLKLKEKRTRVVIAAYQKGDAVYCQAPSVNQVYLLTASSLSALNENAIYNSLKIYPNPTEDRVSIELGSSGLKKVEILDLYGRIISEKYFASETGAEINMQSLNDGLYLFRINTTKGIIVRKVNKFSR